MSTRTLVIAAAAVALVAGGVYLALDRDPDPDPPGTAGTAGARVAPAAPGSAGDRGTRDRPRTRLETAMRAPTAEAPASGSTGTEPVPQARAPGVPQLRPEVVAKLAKRPIGLGPVPGVPRGAARPPDPDLAARAAEARDQALTTLSERPDDVTALRTVVEASCITGDLAAASKYAGKLPPAVQAEVRRACLEYGAAIPSDHDTAWQAGELKGAKAANHGDSAAK